MTNTANPTTVRKFHHSLTDINAAILRVETLAKNFERALGAENKLRLVTAAVYMREMVAHPPFDGEAIMTECKEHYATVTKFRFVYAAEDLNALKARLISAGGELAPELEAKMNLWLEGHKQGSGSVSDFFRQAESLGNELEDAIEALEEVERFPHGKCPVCKTRALRVNEATGKPFAKCGFCYHVEKTAKLAARPAVATPVAIDLSAPRLAPDGSPWEDRSKKHKKELKLKALQAQRAEESKAKAANATADKFERAAQKARDAATKAKAKIDGERKQKKAQAKSAKKGQGKK